MSLTAERSNRGVTRRTTRIAVAAALVAGVLTLPLSPPVSADPTLPLVVDQTLVVVTDGVVVPVSDPSVEVPFVNQRLQAEVVATVDVVVDPADFVAGSLVGDALTRLGLDLATLEANSSTIEANGGFLLSEGVTPCGGASIDVGASCSLLVEVTDPTRPAGVAVELRSGNGDLLGRTFVLWQPDGDRLAGAVPLGNVVQLGDGIPFAAGSTIGRTAEPGEPGHAGSPAVRSWWGSLSFVDQGRLDLTVQALDGPYGQGIDSSTPIRASIYRVAGTAIPPTMAALEQLVPTASGVGPGGTVTLSSSITPGGTYVLAVDDLGVATDFAVSGSFGYGGVGWDPAPTDPLERRTLTVPADATPVAAFTVYNQTPTATIDPPFDFTLPALTDFVWQDASDPTGGCVPTDGSTFPSPGPVAMSAAPGSVCVVRVAVSGGPLALGQSREESVTVTGGNANPQTVTYVLRASNRGNGPGNDFFADAEDLSGLAIPAYVAGQDGQPESTVSVQGTTVAATREPFEYGTVVDEKGTPDTSDDTETAPPTGTVWYRYTAPSNGFSGRLGFRVSPGFEVSWLAERPYSSRAPNPRYDVVTIAPGNTWPPSGLRFARMEPGHTVWFQVSARSDTFTGTTEPDGEFTFELYQAPNEQDSIVNAYDVNFGRPWSLPFNWGGDGDTFHLTADRVGGPADGWFTATFDRPGYWSFTARSETASGELSVRPLGLRIFRSPTIDPVTSSSELGSPFAQTSGSLRTSPFVRDRNGVAVSGWEVSLRNVPVEPGRYYWTFDEGADDPTFFSLSSTYDSLPKATASVTDCEGAAVALSSDEFAFGGLFPGVPALPTTSEQVFGGSATGFGLSAQLSAGVGDQPGDTVSATCAPSASVEGELLVDSELGSTAPVPVPVRVLGTARATEALRGAIGSADVLADAGVVATVTITDPDTNQPVFSYERRLDRTSSATPGGASTSRGTTTTRLNGAPVPGVPDTDVTGTVTCAAGAEGTCTVAPDATGVNSPVPSSVSLRPGVGYRYRLSLEASVTARSSDQAAAALTSALLDAGESLHLALTAPAGTSLRCSSSGRYCQSRLPGDAPDTTPPDTTLSAPPATNATDVTVTLGADEGNVTYECRTGANQFAPCSNPFVLPNAAEGPVTIEGRATDSSNNVDPTPASVTVVVDRTPPTASIEEPADGATFEPAAVPAAAIAVCSDPAPGAGVATSEVRVDGVPTDALAASPGLHTVRLDCADAAGNTSSVTHTYNVTDVTDTTPPETAIDSVTLSGRNVSVTVSATDDGPGPLTFECAVTEQLGFVPGVVVWQPCGSPVSFTNLAEGYYLVLARGRDAAGNVDATPAIRAFTVDVSPPQVAIFSPVDGSTYRPGGVPQLFWSCTDLDIDTSLLSVTVNGVPLVGLDLPSTPGVYTVAVRCVDRAGLATTVTSTYTVPTPDTTPPVITITGIAPGGVVTTATPTVTITSDEPLANVICTLDTPTPGGGTLSNDVGCFTPGDTSDTFTFPDLPDGSVTLTVSGQDEAGNDTTVTLTFSVEVLPTASISSPADGATYFSSEVPTSVSYVCADNGVITTEEVQLVPQDGGPAALLVGRPPNTAGTHTIRVVCVDGLGEEATATATYTVVVPDTTPPETAIDSVTLSGRDVSVVVSGTDDGAGPLTFECAVTEQLGFVPGVVVWQPCGSPVSFTNLAEGYYLVLARGRDAAGNVDATPAIRAFTVDVSPPQVAIFSPVDGSTYRPGGVPQLFWSCTDLDIDSSLLSATVNGVPLVGLELPSSPGVYTVAVRCVDKAGLATTATSTYTVVVPDTTPPETSIDSVTLSGRDVSVVVSGTDDGAGPLTFECAVTEQLGFVPGVVVWQPCVSPVSFTNLAEGYYLVLARGRDAAGNVDATPAIRAFTVDVSPPQVAIFSPVDGSTYPPGGVPQLFWSCTDLDIDSSLLSVTVNGVPLVGLELPSSPGVYTVAVRCVDRAGLATTVTSTYTVPTPDTTPPTITITGIAPGSTVSSTSEPSVTISSDEPLSNVICTVDIVRDDDGRSSSNDVGCLPAPPTTGGGFTFPALPDGSVTLTVLGEDAAGNDATATLSFDVQVEPVVTITSPVDGASFFVGSVPPLAYTCTDNNGVVVAETLSVGPNGDPWPGAPPSTPGTWRINVDCLDAVGNGGTAAVTYTVRERPGLSVDIVRDPLGNPVPSATPMRFTVRVRNEGTQSVGRKTVRIVLPDQLFVTTAGVDPLTGTGTGSRFCTFSPGVPFSGGIGGQVITCVLVDELAPGATDDLVVLPELRGPDGTAVAVSASVSADGCVDAQGGPVCGTASSLFSIGPPPDTTAPVISITGIANGDVVTDATPSVTISSDEPLFATICNLETPTPQGGTDSNDVGCLADGLSSETFDLPDLPDGSVTLTVFGQDAAGNRAQATVTFSVEVLPTASITAPADGATYRSSEVPTSVSYVCSDNGVITTEEVQLVPQDGGTPVLLVGAPPRTAGTHTVRVVCVDGLGEEAVATATYTVLPEGIVSVRTRDVQDEAPVVGACYALRRQLFVAVTIQSCDAASGPNADGAADGVTRFSVPFAGTYSLVGETVPQSSPGGRFTAPTQSVPVVLDTQVDVDAWTYRCASTCLLVQPKLGDGSEPTFPLWPLGVPGDLVAPVPLVPPGATSPPPFPTAFVIPDLTPGVATDIPVVADDFGRTPLEVGRIRVTPTAGLNRLEPLTILPAHTVTVNLQNPDGTPNASGGVCLQLRPVSFASRPTVAQCSAPGQSRLLWRALPGEYVVEQETGQLPPPGLLAPVLPVNVFDTQRELQVSLDFRFAPGATVRVNAVNFQGNPITQLPAGVAPTCEIGLFLVTNGTIAAAPTATACFGGGSPPASAVFRVPPGTYVVTKTAQFALSPLSTGANFVTVGSGDDVTTDLVFFRPEVGAPAEPTARPDVLTVRPGTSGTVNLLTNDTPSAPGEALSVSIVSGPTQGQLVVGAGGSVTYTAAPSASGTDAVTYDAVDPWGNRSRSTLTVTIQPWAQLGLTVTAAPTPVAIGGLFEYVVVVTNPSPTERARGMQLKLVMPPGAGMVRTTQLPPFAGCSFTPPLSGGAAGTPAVTVDCAFADLAPNGVATLRVEARVLGGTAGTTLPAAATLGSSDCLDVDPVAAGSQCLAPVVGGPAVASATLVAETTQSWPPPGSSQVGFAPPGVTPRVGDLIRQRFRVTNTGTLTARNMTMVVTFPAELGMTNAAVLPRFAGCSFSPPLSGGQAGTPSVKVSCVIPDLLPGEVRDLEIDARVLAVPVAPAAAILFDVGSSDCPDRSPRPGMQCATAAGGPGIDRVNLVPAVRVERVGGGTTFAVGDDVLVVATVRNDSGIPARSPTVRVALPAELGMTGVETLPSFAGCSFVPPLSGGAAGTPSVTVPCAFADLPASTTATLTLRAKVLALPAAGLPFDVSIEAGSRDCRDQTVGDGRQVCATAVNATPVVPLATPGGGLTLQVRPLSGGSPYFGAVQNIAPSVLGVLPPPGVGFPYGAMSFSVYDVPVGGSITVDITTPSAVGGYWKLVDGTWSRYQAVGPIPGGATGLRITLVDGGIGDADGVANGVIVDPGAVGAPNVGPTAPNRTVSTPQGTSVNVDVLTGASDSDGGVPEIVEATDGTSGRVTATTADVTYTPEPEFTGEDTFTVRIGDGQGGSTTVTVTVQVGQTGGPPPPPPAIPVGVADNYWATAGTALDVPTPGVLANDQGADLTAELVEGPSVGSLTLRPDGSFSYLAPPAATAGTVTFTYRPSGPSGIGSETTVTIDVAAATVSKYAPLVSTRRDRGSATPLTGALLSGSVAVFVPTAREIDRVEWFLDDPTMTGRPRQVERFAPYDFNGTALDGRALLYPTRLLADGPHTVTARVVRRDGRTEVVTSAFTVSNPRPATRVLSFSTSSRRSNPAPLDGASLTGPVAVFVPPESDIASVRFSVDGVLRSTERFAAYDLGTTNANGTARLVTFPPGAHVVTARIEFDDGFVDTLTAQFTVTRE